MPDAKITQLPTATLPLAGTEKAEVVQGGVNKQVDVSELGTPGIQSIVAGTNVTVDDTDPRNPIVNASGVGAVDSVNGQTGEVVLDAADVGAEVALILETVSTAGATITLDSGTSTKGLFVGSAAIATPKAIVLDGSVLVYDFHFQITNVAGVLTFDDHVMNDINWNVATKEWTPPSTGSFEGGAVWDGTNWKLKINGPFL